MTAVEAPERFVVRFFELGVRTARIADLNASGTVQEVATQIREHVRVHLLNRSVDVEVNHDLEVTLTFGRGGIRCFVHEGQRLRAAGNVVELVSS